jgi:SpoVK/Ycf46/Vps4 family AAA+-type ATPase
LAPDRLAADLASATQGLTGADIAYLCQRAVMFCVKDRSRGGATAARRFDIAGLAARAAAVRAAGIYLAAGAT